MTDSPSSDPGQPVILPGDPQRNNRAERRKNGMPQDNTPWGNIAKAWIKQDIDRNTMESAARRKAAISGVASRDGD